MMLDKERETRLEKIYKETNKKHEEWRASVQHQKDKNKIGQEKYKRKWKARHAYLKWLSTTTFIQYCCSQVCVRKELQRL